jgi:polyphenol oxidase
MSAGSLPLIRPAWAMPGVRATMTTREGGVSEGPWSSLNLGTSVGDEPEHVAENRRRFVAALGGARPVWLRQVHGVQVLRLDRGAAENPPQAADAAWTMEPGIACVVQVADCLPVLLAAVDGRAVGAVHAGWRGLAAGVLEATLTAMERDAGVPAAQVRAWLGPCIGPRRFEVGADVLAAFGAEATPQAPGFVFRPRPDGAPRWLADLRGLAAQRLRAAGVTAIESVDDCTFEDGSRFFSFRRDATTGRMAAAIALI